MTWPGDLNFGDLDLKFSGKLRKSCSNSYAKKPKGGGCSNIPPVGRGLTVYGNGTSKKRDRIQKILNLSPRVITGRKNDHISDVQREARAGVDFDLRSPKVKVTD